MPPYMTTTSSGLRSPSAPVISVAMRPIARSTAAASQTSSASSSTCLACSGVMEGAVTQMIVERSAPGDGAKFTQIGLEGGTHFGMLAPEGDHRLQVAELGTAVVSCA